jgi:hypothetical protein
VSGAILQSLFEAELNVKADFASNGALQFFNVKATLKANPQLNQLSNAIKSEVLSGLNTAKAAIDNAQRNVDNARSQVDSASKNLCQNIEAKCSVTNCKGYEQRCTGGWKSVCTSTTRKCTKKLPSWLGWACKGWSEVCTGTTNVCQGWSDVCSGFQTFLDEACKQGCNAAQSTMNAASDAMNAANSAMEQTERGFGELANAANSALNFVGELFVLQEAKFELVLSPEANTNNIQMSLRTTFMGKSHNFQILFNFNDVASTAKRIANKILDNIKNGL